MVKVIMLLFAMPFINVSNAQNIGIGTTSPNSKLDVRGSSTDEETVISVGNLDQSHILKFYGGRENDPNPIIRWRKTDALRFVTDSGGLTEFMRIDKDGTVGIGTSTPSSSAKLEVNSTTQGFLPPRLTKAQRNLINPVEGLIIYNSTTKKPNYFNGLDWMNYDGTLAFDIGDPYQGGLLAYILQPADMGYDANKIHGLIAAVTDQDTGVVWGCYGTATGAVATAIGAGNQNTIDITAGCLTPGIAARLCSDLVLNGYSDWYLPSFFELKQLQFNKIKIGGFADAAYWSSSESDLYVGYYLNPYEADYVDFSDGSFDVALKTVQYHVRAIRSF